MLISKTCSGLNCIPTLLSQALMKHEHSSITRNKMRVNDIVIFEIMQESRNIIKKDHIS